MKTLILETNDILSKQAQAYLITSWGYTPQIVINLENAKHYLSKNKPDLVILDYFDRSAEECLELLMFMYGSYPMSTPKIIVYSSNAYFNRNRELLGIDAVFNKPLDVESLSDKLKEYSKS